MLKINAHSMDQNRDIYGLKNSKNCDIDLNEVVKFGSGNEKKKVARRRWGILAKALKSPSGSEPSSPTDDASVRRISSFMLLTTARLSSAPVVRRADNDRQLNETNKRTWYKYSFTIDDCEYLVNVGHRDRTFSAEDLMGFNNTGNICIWPSEETLSYYVCSNLPLFNDKTVLELGGGMSCLAGLFVAKYGSAKHVTVTDGNKISVDNVQATLHCNEFKGGVSCRVLKWGAEKSGEKYDVVLCADCLFFDDARADLIDCIRSHLAQSGTAYVMAPQRGATLDEFVRQSELKGFKCRKVLNYSGLVWDKRAALLSNFDYNDNIHYPILIEVTNF
ncbi:unnamed protein product [Brassicogethes aeneus]|uniref:Calmodulin-lysine N-methyltransferase n=1 Tax=Brassicogethes aeneus TaxID=1431903 RepID=A0A9P0B3C5_BRAAE|nr:unnamed protein product [Brassicogethes aeneus]